MKSLRAKLTGVRPQVTTAAAAFLFTVMAVSNRAMVMTATSPGWGNFKQAMTDFFYHGMGGDGAQGVGITIAVIGILLSAISFVVHKLNPQSRLPGWFTCLVVALIGTLLFTGVAPVLKIVQWFRDTVLGWFGFSGFGDFS